MSFSFDTPRLHLRELTSADADFAYRLNLNPNVIRYTGDDPFESVEAARCFLEEYSSYQRYGFGRWGVELKTTGELIGLCGLKYTPELDEFDIGFRFFEEEWGNGYATEAATECLKLGFERFGMKTIVGRAMKENIASIRVLEKIGLIFYSDYQFEEEQGVLYKIDQITFLRY